MYTLKHRRTQAYRTAAQEGVTLEFLHRASPIVLTVCLTATMLVVPPAAASPLSFTPFVTSTDLSSLFGNSGTIGFTYAGNKFVGSVYIGVNNKQLYSTNLSGTGLQLFGNPITAPSPAPPTLSSSLGLGGFPSRDVYASDGATIYHFSNNGLNQRIFTTLPSCGCFVRGIMFDDVGSFGHKMIVSTTSGQIFSVTSAGVATQIANLGQDTEGLAIATAGFGPYAGSLLVGSEYSGQIHTINPSTMVVTDLGINIPGAEMLSSVPLSLGEGGPLEGFYAPNYPADVLKAGANQFYGLQGDLLVTGELDHFVTDVHWNGSGFTLTNIGTFPDQPEDGIFVTGSILNPVPEPSTLLLLGAGVLELVAVAWRKLRFH